MTTLLHLDSGAHQSEESVTRSLGARFAQRWTARHPEGRYRHHDLVEDPAAPLDSAYARLGRRLEREGLPRLCQVASRVQDDAEAASWAATLPLVEELVGADVVLLAAPMYNFGLPAALKAWIDRVTFPGVLRPADEVSPLDHVEFVLVGASGGCYGPDTPRAPLDHHLPHLVGWLTAYGARPERVHSVRAEGTLAPLVPHLTDLRPLAEHSLAQATATLDELAETLPTGGTATPATSASCASPGRG